LFYQLLKKGDDTTCWYLILPKLAALAPLRPESSAFKSGAWAPLGQVTLHRLSPWKLFFHINGEEQSFPCSLSQYFKVHSSKPDDTASF